MEKSKNNKENTSQKVGVCVECKVRDGDSNKKKLYRCPHCGKWFCEKHIEPRIATTRGAIEQIKDPVLRDKILDEWRRPDGHPDMVWTRKYFEDLRKKQEEEREKFWEAVMELEKVKTEEKAKKFVETSIKPTGIRRSISFKRPILRRPIFRMEYSREKIDSLIWIGLLIYIISLFLPWISFSFLGFEIGASWLAIFQDELGKIKSRGIVDYLTTSHYTLIGLIVFPLLGLATIILGVIVGRNWIILTGSLFAFISPLTLLYYLSQGISAGYIHISLTSLAGIGLWLFLLSSILIASRCWEEITSIGILVSFLIVGISSWLLLFKPNFLQYFISSPIINQTAVKDYTHHYEEVKYFIEKTIKDYLSPSHQTWVKRSINDLKFGVVYFSGSFKDYTVCDQGLYACEYGKEKGENVNYLYCRPSYFSSYIFCYKKTLTSDSGEIQDVIRKCVYEFVVDPKTLQVLSVKIGELAKDAKILC